MQQSTFLKDRNRLALLPIQRNPFKEDNGHLLPITGVLKAGGKSFTDARSEFGSIMIGLQLLWPNLATNPSLKVCGMCA